MEIGTEISQKIRSAIKAKLIELGAYVDDELPDYIMVMVANKRSQKQMTDDLSLFLSTNTEKFTNWLHGLLKKLQSINTDQVQGKPKHKEKHKPEKKKHRTSTSEKTNKLETDKATASDTKEEQKKQKVENKEPQSKVTEKITSTVKSGEEEPATEINISENTDEFNEENRAVESTESIKPKKSQSGKVSKTLKSSEVKKTAAKTQPQDNSTPGQNTDKETKKGSKKKPSSFVAAVKRKYEEEEEEEEYDPLNPAVGNVASVIRGPTRKSSIPKAMQANRSLLMKAVSDAERSVTTVKRAEVPHTDAASGMKSDQRPVDLRKRLKTAAGLQLLSRSKRKGIEDMTYTIENDIKKPRKAAEDFTQIKYTVKNVKASKSPDQRRSKAALAGQSRLAGSALKAITQTDVTKTVQHNIKKEEVEEEEEEEEEDEGQYGPPLPDTRVVQKAPKAQTDSNEDSNGYTDSVSDNGPDPEIQKILEEAKDTDLNLNIDSPLSYQYVENKRIINREKKTPSPKDPRFIVTLDGVDPAKFADFQEEKTNIIQTVKPMARPPSVPVPEPIEPSKPPVETEMYSKITPPKIKPFNINLKESDDEEETEEQPSPTPSASILERCRFWPACVNGSACQYIHPSIPCKTFPYCKFGDKCVYIHPNCKYDAKCTRVDCPFTHASKRSTIHPTVIHKIVQVPVQPFIPSRPLVQAPPRQTSNCRFYPNCTNMNCTFIHPKPCRYGIGCMNKSTCTFYHPALPTKDKLKWIPANKKQSNPVMEAARDQQVNPAT